MQTPSTGLLAAAAPPGETSDAHGRRLDYRRLGALDKLRLFEAAGADLSGNDRWLGMAVLAASVTAIDSIPVPFPATKHAVEAAVQRLGDHGIAAIARALAPEQGPDLATAGN